MRIVHAGWFALGSAHGTHAALWELARAQARTGHDVSILNLGWLPPADAVTAARRAGVRLLGVECPMWGRFWIDENDRLRRQVTALRPDIVHLQYVRIPRFLALSRVLSDERIPFVVSPHGGLMSAEMRRHARRKQAYWYLVERGVHRRAAGLHFVTRQEQEDYYRSLGADRPADAVIPNIVDPDCAVPPWRGAPRPDAARFVSLGRYDVWHKGLDLAAAMVRDLRRAGVAAELHLHGAAAGRLAAPMARLRRAHADLPLHDHGIVSGARKFASLASYDIYLQYSRFELFGMALVEALRTGMPVMLSERCDLAAPLAEAGAAIVLPMNPRAAAERAADGLRRPSALAEMARRGHAWWAAHCRADVVNARMLAFYAAACRTAGGWRAAA